MVTKQEMIEAVTEAIRSADFAGNVIQKPAEEVASIAVEALLNRYAEDWGAALWWHLSEAKERAEEAEAQIGELQFKLQWWEGNYGHGRVFAPSRDQNEKFLNALANLEQENTTDGNDYGSLYEMQREEND